MMRQAALGGMLSVVLMACGAVPLEERSPGGFDLTGHWIATDEAVSDGALRSGFMSQDFPLLITREMRIEQDASSMGVEYGRGNYRDVTWGERKLGVWEIRAGWLDGALHIYSEAPDTSASEVWHLSEDGTELAIDVRVKGERARAVRRTFTRSTGL
jgi:hypothetical protein